MDLIDQKTLIGVYRRIGKVSNPDAVFCFDDVCYTIVEMPMIVETVIGRFIMSGTCNTETTFDDYVDLVLDDSMDLKDAIVEKIIKPEYEYVPTGIVEMLANKSRKSISCGSTWPQIIAFVHHVLDDKGIGKKEKKVE